MPDQLHPGTPARRQPHAHARTEPVFKSAALRILAVVCAFMVLFAATVRVAHSHTPSEQESGHCQVCIAIHTAVPASAPPVQVIQHAAAETIVTPSPRAPEKVRVVTLSDRAPPVAA